MKKVIPHNPEDETAARIAEAILNKYPDFPEILDEYLRIFRESMENVTFPSETIVQVKSLPVGEFPIKLNFKGSIK